MQYLTSYCCLNLLFKLFFIKLNSISMIHVLSNKIYNSDEEDQSSNATLNLH